MVNNPAYFTNPNAFGPPVQSLAEQLAAQGFLSPGMQGPGEEMFYGFSPEAQGLMGSSDNRMYAGQSITPELMRYMAQSWAGGQKSSRSPDEVRKMFPSYLHQFMPQLDPRTQVRYQTYGADKVTKEPFGQDHYSYSFDPIAAPKFQELPSIDIQKRMEQETEAEGAEWDRERSGLLRSGAGRNVFGTGRT